MSSIALVLIMALAVPMVMSNQGEPVPFKSLCVMDKLGTCWTSEGEGKSRPLQDGDYALNPEEFDRLLEKLKSCQK